VNCSLGVRVYKRLRGVAGTRLRLTASCWTSEIRRTGVSGRMSSTADGVAAGKGAAFSGCRRPGSGTGGPARRQSSQLRMRR
jgi:hypothetical protein